MKNTFWLSIAQIISKGLKFVLIVIATRILGPEQYGVFTYAIYLIGFFFAFPEFGLSILLMREYQKATWDHNVLLSAIFSIRSAFSLLALIAAFFFSLVVEDALLKDIFRVFLFIFFISSFRDLYISLARANNRMEYDSIAAIIDAVIVVGVGIPVLILTKSLAGLVFAYALAAIIVTPFLILSTTRSFSFAIRPFTLKDVRYLLKQGFPFMIANISLFLLMQVDVIMLKHYFDYSTVGTYSAGMRIVQFISFIPGLLILPVFPLLSRKSKDTGEIKKLAKTTLALICMISFPITLGGIALSDEIIIQFFGDKFSSGITPFRILICITPFFFIDGFLDYLLISQKRQFLNTVFTFIAGLLNIIFNLILVPRMAGSGAALASVISQAVNMAITYRYARSQLNFSLIDWRATRSVIVSAAGMSIIVFLMARSFRQIPVFFFIFCGIFLYFFFLRIMKERTLDLMIRRLKIVLLHKEIS